MIDVVIPTNNRARLLSRAVEALLPDSAVGQVIVVDDHKSAGGDTRAAIEGHEDRCTLITGGGVGPAGARQRGAEAATAELVLFLDDDVIPSEGLASAHLGAHGSHPHMVVCGYSPIDSRDGGGLSPEANVYAIAYERRCKVYDSDDFYLFTHFWGGNFSLRRADALTVGLISATFPDFWHEDRDFGLRCLEAGLVPKFDRDLRAAHLHERTWKMVSREAYGRGYSLVRLHYLHQGTIGGFAPHHYERGLPAAVRRAVRYSSVRGLGAPLLLGLRVVRELGTALRRRRLQMVAVRMLRRVQGTRGADAALRELGPDGQPRRGAQAED